jgi:hypothetical protein
MNAQEIVNRLITVEMDSTTEPDMRRVLREERKKLQSALEGRPVNAAAIDGQMREAVRVAAMWGVDL